MTFEMLKKNMIFRKIKIFLEMIKFEHSVFALPFAYVGMWTAAGGFPGVRIFLWVTAAMICLRTCAMSLNRLIDQNIDGLNPRTQNRAMPAGLLERRFVWAVSILTAVLFVFSASRLNALCFYLSPIPLILVMIYPYLKRWVWFSHWVLGLILGIAPYGGWLAVRPEWSLVPLSLTIAVMCWVGGFDVLYSLQDVEFDRTQELKSLVVKEGERKAVFWAKTSQGLSLIALVLFGIKLQLGFFYWIGLILAGFLIYREHALVARHGLLKIDEAFFNMNAWVSVIIFLGTFLHFTVAHG